MFCIELRARIDVDVTEPRSGANTGCTDGGQGDYTSRTAGEAWFARVPIARATGLFSVAQDDNQSWQL